MNLNCKLKLEFETRIQNPMRRWPMKYVAWTILILSLALVPAGIWYQKTHTEVTAPDLVLHGNVDLRQVEVAFANSERIDAVLVQEGDRVQAGQVLARQDTRRLDPQVSETQAQIAAQRSVIERLKNGNRAEEIDQARAQVAAQKAVVEKLKNGSRAEEIEQARAQVQSVKAEVALNKIKHERLTNILNSGTGAITVQEVDNAKAELDVSIAKLAYNENALTL